MVWLSIRLVRTALIASVTALGTTYAAPTLAQVPVYQAPSEPEPEPEPEPGVPATSAAVAPTPHAAPPVPAVAAPAAALSSSRTPPARASVITAPRAADIDDDDDDQTEDARLGPRRKWYGWQTLVADGASFALVTLAVVIDQHNGGTSKSAPRALAWFGALGYELAPGMIHFMHQNPGRGFGSIGLRFGLPLAGAIVGQAAAKGCSGFRCEDNGVEVGVAMGVAGAIALDAAVLAYEDPKKPSPRGLSLLPFVAVMPRQALVGLGGNL